MENEFGASNGDEDCVFQLRRSGRKVRALETSCGGDGREMRDLRPGSRQLRRDEGSHGARAPSGRARRRKAREARYARGAGDAGTRRSEQELEPGSEQGANVAGGVKSAVG